MTTRLIGRWGEAQAAEYLRKKRYQIIAMNYYTRFGEIDIIAHKRDILAFVEVKLRKDASFARAREFVAASKQKKLVTAAELYLAQNPTKLQPRFDVIEIYAPDGIGGRIEISHLENAFQ